MKKYLFLAAAVTVMASCSDNTYMGDLESGAGTGAISFNMSTPALSRAQDHTTSAATLHNQFIVWGEKSTGDAAETGSAGNPVFINYVVNYVASTAHTTESNSSDWEYVAQTPYAAAKVTSTGSPATISEQTIKYWDFTNKNYTFTAISALPANISEDKVIITKNVSGSTVYDKGYTVELKAGASINDIYFSDRTLVTATSPMTTPVNLNFRNLVSQVRFGFYETIPGYSVAITDVKFNSSSHTVDGADKFGVDCAGAVLVPGASTSFTVTYDDGSVNVANRNKAKVAVGGSNAQDYLSTTATSFFGTTLGTTSDDRTWENGGNYTKILPNPSNTTDLTLTISYQLTSTDGSGETIDITNATAKVPAAYAKWQSNYAYSYLFKISDNNGLYPITFDAVVVEDEAGNQETITTVATPSITTYAKGVNPTVAAKAEYPTSSNIYVVVDKNGTVQALTVGTNAKLYTAEIEAGAAQGITEETVANAIAQNSDGYDAGTVLENGTALTGYYTYDGSTYTPAAGTADGTTRYYRSVTASVKDANGKKLVVKDAAGLSAITEIAAADAPDGKAITVNGAKFTPAAAGTYVFEFTDTSDGNKKYYKVIKVIAAP